MHSGATCLFQQDVNGRIQEMPAKKNRVGQSGARHPAIAECLQTVADSEIMLVGNDRYQMPLRAKCRLRR
jgi:hypothetical protein